MATSGSKERIVKVPQGGHVIKRELSKTMDIEVKMVETDQKIDLRNDEGQAQLNED